MDDQIARIEQIDFGDPPQLITEEEPIRSGSKENEGNQQERIYFFRENGLPSEIHLENGTADVKNVIESEIDNLPSDLNTSGTTESVSNGDTCRIVGDRHSPWDSHQRNTCERHISESFSESDAFLGVEKTVESSTETIVADGTR